jgi:hypothetical protein
MRGLMVEGYKSSLTVKGIALTFERIRNLANCRERKDASNANSNLKEQKHRGIYMW